MISSSLVVSQSDFEWRTLPWPILPLHMHRQIIMSHNLVTEMKEKLTGNEIDAPMTFRRDTFSNMSICLFTLLAKQEPSRFVCPDPISIW